MALSCPLGITRCVPHENIVLFRIINALLTKLGRSRWLDIGLIFFCVFMDLDSVSVHKHTKKNEVIMRVPNRFGGIQDLAFFCRDI